MSVQKLVINACYRHNCHSVSIEDDDGGLRITPNKCCGSWKTVKEWDLSAHAWRELAALAEYAAREKEPATTPPTQQEARAVALLREVAEWIDGWEPNFVDDAEWPAVAERIQAITQPGAPK